ncbi:MAG: DUF4190 domain-containing protein [Terriglobales bacterium]
MAASAPACPHCGGQSAAPAAAAAAAAPRANGFAIASLVLGILWLGWSGSILAIVFGHIAHNQISNAGGRQSGRGMATAGLVLGYIGLVTLIVVIALGILGSMIASITSSGLLLFP